MDEVSKYTVWTFSFFSYPPSQYFPVFVSLPPSGARWPELPPRETFGFAFFSFQGGEGILFHTDPKDLARLIYLLDPQKPKNLQHQKPFTSELGSDKTKANALHSGLPLMPKNFFLLFRSFFDDPLSPD